MAGMSTKEFKDYLKTVKDPAKRKALLDQLSPQARADLEHVDKRELPTWAKILTWICLVGLTLWQGLGWTLMTVGKFIYTNCKRGTEWLRSQL